LAGKPTAWVPIRGGGASQVDVASERDMKRVVLNRKNSLFVGNERGGETAAILSSLTATCKRHGVDPQLYLTQALTNVPQASGTDLERWLPDRWKVEQAHRVKQLGE
jgi:glucosamine 6-phosphate synthetase-like amidotransferase/phosphosugar isomerase protein